jgi:2-C-methyl-D-erythritol 4-phosphate cytidylyltransferase
MALDGKRIHALLLMGGEGKRFGGETPKQFLMLAGKKVYLHTLDVFAKCPFFDEILLICHSDWIEQVRIETIQYPNIRIVLGGETRQQSSYLGLKASHADIVVIHDAVRPFVTEEILQANVRGAIQHGAVDTCIPSADTLVQALENAIVNIPDRKTLLRGQTPQSFRYEWILKAHEASKAQATDDCRLVLDLGYPVHIVPGDESNIKITTELDLFLAEQLFRLRCKTTPPTMKGSLHGKLIAVVGGTGGIGQAICHQLKEAGALPIPLSRSSSYPIDLTQPLSIQQAFNHLHTQFGPLDGLINCAGKLAVKPLAELSLPEIEELLAVNLQGLILCCHAVKLKEGAHLINISSSSFSRGRKHYGVYSSAKAGVVNFTQSLAEERPDLRIWSVIPQRTLTPMRTIPFPNEDPTTLLHPNEIAEQILQILQDPHSTGQLLEIRK